MIEAPASLPPHFAHIIYSGYLNNFIFILQTAKTISVSIISKFTSSDDLLPRTPHVQPMKWY